MKTWMLAAVLFTTGCGGWEKNESGIYQLSIDPAWDKHHANMIWQASQDWQSAVDNKVSFNKVQGLGYPDQILVSPSSIDALTNQYSSETDIQQGHETVGRTTYEGEDSLVELSINMSDYDFRIVAQHEIGHAIGMDHIGAGTIMCEALTCQSDHLTCLDLVQFCSIWICDSSQFKLCQ